MAFCALIHRFHPKLIDFKSLSPNDQKGSEFFFPFWFVLQNKLNNEIKSLGNLQKAFKAMEKLEIEVLMDLEDFEEEELDSMSMMTFLSSSYKILKLTPPGPGFS